MGKANEQRDSVGRTEYLKTDHSGVLMLLRDSTRKRQTLLVKERNRQTQKKRKKNQKISANNKRMNATSACVCRLAGCYRQKTSKLQKPNKIHFFSLFIFYSFTKQKIFFFPLNDEQIWKGGKNWIKEESAHTEKRSCAQRVQSLFIRQRRSQRDQSTRRQKGFPASDEFLCHLQSSIFICPPRSWTSAVSFLPYRHTHKRKTVVESNTEMGAAILTYK